MNNPHDYEPSRFYAELGNDGTYWVYDRTGQHAAQGPFYDGSEAVEHARKMNAKY